MTKTQTYKIKEQNEFFHHVTRGKMSHTNHKINFSATMFFTEHCLSSKVPPYSNFLCFCLLLFSELRGPNQSSVTVSMRRSRCAQNPTMPEVICGNQKLKSSLEIQKKSAKQEHNTQYTPHRQSFAGEVKFLTCK